MKPSQNKERLVEALEVAEDMFWNSIATAYPEIKTGDFSPDLAFEMSDKLSHFVTVWLKMNEPASPKPKVAEVMLHRIEYSYDDTDLKLTIADEAYIADKISRGLSEGNLTTMVSVTTEKFDIRIRGYWKINNNPDA